MIFQRWAAARAFKRLSAFDPHVREREALVAMGVGAGRIAALYDAQFDALAPALIGHLACIPDRQLLQIQPWSSGVAAVFRHLPQPLTAKRAQASSMTRSTDTASGFGEIYAYLNQRFEPYEKQRDALMTHNSVWMLGDALWHAHWFMDHRAELPRRVRGQVDRLMLQVAHAIRL